VLTPDIGRDFVPQLRPSADGGAPLLEPSIILVVSILIDDSLLPLCHHQMSHREARWYCHQVRRRRSSSISDLSANAPCSTVRNGNKATHGTSAANPSLCYSYERYSDARPPLRDVPWHICRESEYLFLFVHGAPILTRRLLSWKIWTTILANFAITFTVTPCQDLTKTASFLSKPS
jgi:hypothetical protein